jgi:hypothetical protein
MARIVNIKKDDGSSGNIPEQLGNIKIKTGSTTSQDVKKLYAKTSSGNAELVWDITTTTTTNESTQPPVGPCDNQPTCPNPNESVYYPLIPGTTNRWNCNLWKNCGNAIGLEFNTSISDNIALTDPDDNASGYAKVYDFIGSTPLPPPPGYVLMDYQSYSVADRVAIYINKNIESTASDFYNLTKDDPNSEILFPDRDPAFNQSHGNNSQVIYSLGCNCGDDTCSDNSFAFGLGMPLCQIDSAGSFPICSCNAITCADGCFCLGTTPYSQGQSQQCRTLDELDNNFTNFIIESTCTATDEGCRTVCYGTPAQSTQGDDSPSGGYSCRFVGKVPNIVTGSYVENGGGFLGTFENPQYVYKSAFQLKDFAIVSDIGCRYPDDCPDKVNPPCDSAWKIKIFLPFYVNLPQAKYPSGSGLSSGSLTDSTTTLNLQGKYIEIIKNNININLINQYNNHPILKTIQNLLLGEIRSCSAILSFPYDKTDKVTSASTTNWAITEWPRQINATTPSHTHQLVLEFNNPTANNCGLCFSGNNVDITKCSFIRFYPICDSNGVLYSNFSNFGKALYGDSTSNNFLNGINNALYSIRQQYHPSLGLGTYGELFHNFANFFTIQNSNPVNINGSPYYALYQDQYFFLSYVQLNFLGNAITNPNLRINPILNKIQQLPITLSQSTDCQCIPI